MPTPGRRSLSVLSPIVAAALLLACAQAQTPQAQTAPAPGSTAAKSAPNPAASGNSARPGTAAHTTAHRRPGAATRRRTTSTAAARAARAKAASAAAAAKTPPAALPGHMAPAPMPALATANTSVPRSTVAPDVLPHHTFSAQVRSGVFEYDGLVGKIHLDYKIKDQGYLYFFVPNVGTAVVALEKIPGFTYVHHGIRGNTLTFPLNGHTYQLSSSDALLGKGEKRDVYVRLDPAALGYDRFPMVGFGNSGRAPFRFPASLPENQPPRGFLTPPPIPAGMLPKVQNTSTSVVPGKP